MDKIKSDLLNMLPDLGITLLILIFGILLTLLVARIVRKTMSKTKLDPSLVNFFCRTIRIVGYVIVAIAVLTRLGVPPTGLIASFSAALAAVAIALKDSLSDIAGGIIILFTRPFVTGDFIEFSGGKGFVQKIDMIHTNILTYDDTNIIVPNSKLTTDKINNYTAHNEMRVLIEVPVSYSADIDQVKKVLLDTVSLDERILSDEGHTPCVRLERFGESSLDFTLRCYTSFENYWGVYYELIEKIKKRLDQNNIPIPYNQLDVHIVENVK